MKKQNHLELPSALTLLLHELGHTGSSRYIGAVLPVSVRLELGLYAMVDVLTQRAGTSRNKVMNQLVEVAIDTVLNELPEQTAMEIRQEQGKVLIELLKQVEPVRVEPVREESGEAA